MKLKTIIIAAALAIPAVSFAQSNQPLTRADVKGQLVQIEQAGYNPSMDHTTYPAEVQKAEAKIEPQTNQSSYGGVADGSAASGGYRATANVGSAPGLKSVYFGH